MLLSSYRMEIYFNISLYKELHGLDTLLCKFHVHEIPTKFRTPALHPQFENLQFRVNNPRDKCLFVFRVHLCQEFVKQPVKHRMFWVTS